jgi:hypothetical protein
MVMGAPQSLVTAAFVFIDSSLSKMVVLCKQAAEHPNTFRIYSAIKNALVVRLLEQEVCQGGK